MIRNVVKICWRRTYITEIAKAPKQHLVAHHIQKSHRKEIIQSRLQYDQWVCQSFEQKLWSSVVGSKQSSSLIQLICGLFLIKVLHLFFFNSSYVIEINAGSIQWTNALLRGSCQFPTSHKKSDHCRIKCKRIGKYCHIWNYFSFFFTSYVSFIFLKLAKQFWILPVHFINCLSNLASQRLPSLSQL